MLSLILPSDTPRDTSSQDLLPELHKLKHEVDKFPNDIEKWTHFFTLLDKHYEDHPGSSAETKAFAHESYNELLTRFPYLAEVWKQWLIFEFKVNGTEASIAILLRAVDAFPTCLELWVDYISAITLDKKQDPTFIRSQYTRATTHVGLHFSSHPLWDKLLEYETSVDDGSLHLLGLYLQIITIPLYQYAQYYRQFIEINKNYDVSDIIPKETVAEYVAKFNKTSLDDFSLIEKHQVIDDYTYTVFTRTQQAVTEKWPFESALLHQTFTLTNLAAIKDETPNWISYLDHEIAKYDGEEGQFLAVTNLFERSLIPQCLNSLFWMKYIAFINSLKSTNQFELIKDIYVRATSTFVPLDDKVIRFSYVKFLMKHDKLDLSNEYLFDLLRLFNGTGKSKLYLKKQYTQTLQTLVVLWSKVMETDVLLNVLENLVYEYLEHVDRNSKKTDNKDKYVIDDIFITTLPKLLNNDGVAVIIHNYLTRLDDDQRIRKFFNKYHREPVVLKSAAFWNFYVEFEGLQKRNFTNLNAIIYYFKIRAQLPKATVDAILDKYHDIIGANLRPYLELNERGYDNLIKRDNDVSNSLAHNSAARLRLARNNYLVQEIDDSRAFKSNQEEEFLKITRKHAAHPGILVEATPDITNKFMAEGHWISLTDPNLAVPAFPQFKNVEKASAPINYPAEN